MKRIIAALAALALTACATTVGPGTTPAQKKQAQFEMACKYAGGVWQIAKPLASVPAISAKLGDSGQLAVKSLDIAITTTCTQPLDVNNQDALIQRVYDLGGQVMALVIQAQTS
jgi:hypothetical protein